MTEAERLALASPSNAASLTNVSRDSPVRQGGLIRTAAPQANTSLANTFANILRNPSEEMDKRMYSSAPGNWAGFNATNPAGGVNAWMREYYKNRGRY
jgi:hypothetical protein